MSYRTLLSHCKLIACFWTYHGPQAPGVEHRRRFCGPPPNEHHLFHCGWIQARKNTCCDLSRAVADAVADVGCQHRLLSRLLADPEYLKPGAKPNPPKWSKLV